MTTKTILTDAEITNAARQAFEAAVARGLDNGEAEYEAISEAAAIAKAAGRTGTFDQVSLTWTSDIVLTDAQREAIVENATMAAEGGPNGDVEHTLDDAVDCVDATLDGDLFLSRDSAPDAFGEAVDLWCATFRNRRRELAAE